MSIQRTGIAHLEYVVGEIAIEVDQLPNRSRVLSAYGMPDVKDVWGWQYCRRSDRSSIQMAADAASRSLAHGVDPASVDALIVCCGDRLNYHEQNRFLAELSGILQLGEFQSYWIGGAGCVSLFSAVRLGSTLVASGGAGSVLVVGIDKVADDAHRFQRFGVLSDAACSFLIRDDARSQFSIVDATVLSAARTLEHSDDFQAKCGLIQSVIDRFGQPEGFDYDGIEAFFGANVFLPIQELELSLLPIDGSLAWLENTARYGHCYAADPFINLIDFYRDPAHGQVRTTLLASSAHGHFGMIALEKR